MGAASKKMANLGEIAIAVLILVVMAATVPQAEGNGDQKVAISQFLADKSKSVKCSHNNRICQKAALYSKGSVKSLCCKHRCVNELTDRYNCGTCGNVCGFGHACCNGKCHNVAYDRENCGRCGVTCSYKDKCIYGMCSYA